MTYMRLTIFLALVAIATAQTPKPPAQSPSPPAPSAAQPSAQQKRDLLIEKLGTETAPPKKVTLPPRSYAVIVGISRYKNLQEKEQLLFPERDAQAINTVLISPEGGNFKAQDVHILMGSKATLTAIRNEIDTWLPSVAQPGDRVLIYFAGHGFVNGGKAYLAPYDIDRDHIDTTGYPMDELGSVIGSKIRATNKILLTDACHSGFITPEDTASLNHTLSTLNESLFSLTASRDRESSYETADIEGGHGVFTYYVVQGMAGAADTSRDTVVTADELAEYVHTQVREFTKGRQNPTSDRGSYNPEMLISYVPSNADPAAPPEPKTGGLIFETNMDQVEIFLDGNSVGVLSKGKNVQIPGLRPGQHTVKGVRMGYEPDGPREETVYPGELRTVSIKILIPRHRPKAAVDFLDQGLKYYLKGYEQNYKKAAELFDKSFRADPTYSQAAYYLARSYNALFDEDKAKEYYRKAIEIDPDYLEARTNYAGMLLDLGDSDEALRQLDTVLRREPNNADALSHQSQAYRFKELWAQSIEAARKAVQIAPTVAEPHLWMGDSLRLSGKWAESQAEYVQYLKLSNLNPNLSGQLNYYVLGSLIGFGKRKKAAEQDIWKEQRSLAYFGMCDSERKLKRYDSAIAYCQKSLSYYPQDAYAHYALGISYLHEAIESGSKAELDPALRHLQQSLTINPDLADAGDARTNIANIQQYLKSN